MTTWEDVRIGDIVIGHDGLLYGVADAAPTPAGPRITLSRDGAVLSAQPPPGTPIEIWAQRPETAVLQMFQEAGLGPEIIREMNG